jgi:anti-anti-sigma factor
MHGFARDDGRTTWRRDASPRTYRIETYASGPGDYVVRLEGELDLAAGPELDRELEHLRLCEPECVVADLSAATFVDVGTLARLRAAFAELRVVCTDRHMLKVLKLTGLDRALEIFESIADATAPGGYPANVVVLRRAVSG